MVYFEDNTIPDPQVTRFWIPSMCFLTALSQTYNSGHAVGESYPASTTDMTDADDLDITESEFIFLMLEFGHLHRYLLNIFDSCL